MLPNKTKIKAILLKRELLGRIIFKAFFTIDKIRFLHHQIDHKINFISKEKYASQDMRFISFTFMTKKNHIRHRKDTPRTIKNYFLTCFFCFLFIFTNYLFK